MAGRLMVATKVLSKVEAFDQGSNQRELNGVSELRRLLGEPRTRRRVPAHFMALTDEKEPLLVDGALSWYDARANQPHRSAEYRLYYPTNPVTEQLTEGTQVWIVRTSSGATAFVACDPESEIGRKVRWLFGIDGAGDRRFAVLDGDAVEAKLDSTVSVALADLATALGLVGSPRRAELRDAAAVLASEGGIPNSRKMAAFARARLGGSQSRDPDVALVQLMDSEEAFYRALEQRHFGSRLTLAARSGLDATIALALQITNGRKARAGLALQNHFASLLDGRGILYAPQGRTEGRSRPDFLIPGNAAYADPSFPADRLAMVATKTTCKERWRQILTEADRIPRKHLLTLEPAISNGQLDEMERVNVVVVLPTSLHGSFAGADQPRLKTVASLLDELGVLARGAPAG